MYREKGVYIYYTYFTADIHRSTLPDPKVVLGGEIHLMTWQEQCHVEHNGERFVRDVGNCLVSRNGTPSIMERW